MNENAMLVSFCEDYHICGIRRMKTGLENQCAVKAEMTPPDFRHPPVAWR
jgi:hypothetical protein